MFAMPFGKFFHGSSFIKKAKSNTAQQMFQVQYTFITQDAANRICRLSTFMQPVKRLLAVKLNGSRNS